MDKSKKSAHHGFFSHFSHFRKKDSKHIQPPMVEEMSQSLIVEKTPYSSPVEERPHRFVHMPSIELRKRSFDVGGEGDCGFRASAAAILDNIFVIDEALKERPDQELARANHDLCVLLLHKHLGLECFSHYKKEDDQNILITPVERIKLMFAKHKEFVPDLAFTLRQMAVDEMIAHSEDYPNMAVMFEETNVSQLSVEDKDTTPLHMRRLRTWIDESAIAALSNAFKRENILLPISVRKNDYNKRLFQTLHYGPDTSQSKVAQANMVEIWLEGKHYRPMLSHPYTFHEVILQSAFIKADDFAITLSKKDPSMSKIIAKQRASDKKMLQAFIENKQVLTKLLAAGELNKDILLVIYNDCLNQFNSDYLQGRINHIGIEYGNQDFFKRAIDRVSDVDAASVFSDSDLDSDLEETLDMLICEEAIHALARFISISDSFTIESVYAQIEEHSVKSSPSMGP